MRNLKYVILGLLTQKPMTGYEIKQKFEGALSEFWYANHSQIYPELKRLTEEDMIQYKIQIVGNSLEKKVYTITEAGKKAVKRIQDLGMVMDVSHLNDKCFWGVIDLAQGPIIASHSNARSVCPAMRNLTDDMLKAIAKTGGLVGMNSMREFISEKHDEQNVEHLADHVEYIADLIGIDHIGLGFDFDDYLGGEALKTFSDHVDSPSGDGISNEAEAKNILAVLKKRGYSQEDLDKIGYKNFYRVFKEVWK